MCGVIGLLLRDPALEPQLGSLLAPMLEALDERGPDSSGLAVYADHPPTATTSAANGHGITWTLRISLGADVPVDWVALGCSVLDLCPSGADLQRFGAGAVIDVPENSVETVEAALAEQWPQVRVLGTGRNLRVLKDTGRPSDTCARHRVRQWEGYLAIAHTRMATESAVTVLHSHPFVPARDLCVVHNGSFSNYATVRRRLMKEGIEFDSDNDSEVGARYLASRLAAGDNLEEATRWVMKEMDGFFTLVITSADGMSVVRDAFACKPAVVAETAGYVAVASEFRALAELPGIADAEVFEPRPEEVYTWSR
jgi:methylamine---glutamate N-methyltransferase subunit A